MKKDKENTTLIKQKKIKSRIKRKIISEKIRVKDRCTLSNHTVQSNGAEPRGNTQHP